MGLERGQSPHYKKLKNLRVIKYCLIRAVCEAPAREITITVSAVASKAAATKAAAIA